MISKFSKKTIDINLLNFKFIFIFLISIVTCYFYLNLNSLIEVSDYAFNELFINYQAGFIRRGFLGEIYWYLDYFFSLDARIFFSYLFYLLYLVQIYFYYKILLKFKDFILIHLFITLSPALILFNIYDINIFFIKDIFIKLSILLHAYIIIDHFSFKRKYNEYILKLKFFIIPLLILIILIHEYQVLFLSIHFLLTLSFANNRKTIFRFIRIYSFLLIPTILVLFFIGDENQYEKLNLILQKFDLIVHPQLGGGFYKAIGGFYKWHFYYFDYLDFINLLASLFLGIVIFYLLFQFFLEKKIFTLHTQYQKNYFIFFVPTIACFLLALDHGRNISLISTHIIAFYVILKLNNDNLLKKKNEILNNSFSKFILFLSIFFYIFMWKLDQMAGFTGSSGQMIFQSSLFAEFIKLIKYIYQFVDINIINLPEIKL